MRPTQRFSALRPTPAVVEHVHAESAFGDHPHQEPSGGAYIPASITSTPFAPPSYPSGDVQMSHMRVPAGAPAAYTPTTMSEEYVAHDERMLESCHHVNLKNLPAGFWVFAIAQLGVSVACLVMLIILVAR